MYIYDLYLFVYVHFLFVCMLEQTIFRQSTNKEIPYMALEVPFPHVPRSHCRKQLIARKRWKQPNREYFGKRIYMVNIVGIAKLISVYIRTL